LYTGPECSRDNYYKQNEKMILSWIIKLLEQGPEHSGEILKVEW